MLVAEVWTDASLAFVFGSLVGFSEILSRYRDEPLRAAVNRYGLIYLTINGVFSLAAFGLLLRYPAAILPKIASDDLMAALVAGFGAMAVMRSKFFIFRSDDGKEYPIGPAIVIETILQVVNRKIDRLRASQREKRVFDRLKDITNFDGAADYLTASLLSFQNLSQDEKRDIAGVFQQYRSQTSWPSALKTMAIGFAFLTIAGEENFDQVVDDLIAYLKNLERSGSGGGEIIQASRSN